MVDYCRSIRLSAFRTTWALWQVSGLRDVVFELHYVWMDQMLLKEVWCRPILCDVSSVGVLLFSSLSSLLYSDCLFRTPVVDVYALRFHVWFLELASLINNNNMDMLEECHTNGRFRAFMNVFKEECNGDRLTGGYHLVNFETADHSM